MHFRFAVDLPESLLDIFAALRDGSVLDASGFVFDTSPRPSNQENFTPYRFSVYLYQSFIDFLIIFKFKASFKKVW